MAAVRFEATAETDELIDAGEALATLVDSFARGADPCPCLLQLLLALDEAIARAVGEAAETRTA